VRIEVFEGAIRLGQAYQNASATEQEAQNVGIRNLTIANAELGPEEKREKVAGVFERERKKPRSSRPFPAPKKKSHESSLDNGEREGARTNFRGEVFEEGRGKGKEASGGAAN